MNIDFTTFMALQFAKLLMRQVKKNITLVSGYTVEPNNLGGFTLTFIIDQDRYSFPLSHAILEGVKLKQTWRLMDKYSNLAIEQHEAAKAIQPELEEELEEIEEEEIEIEIEETTALIEFEAEEIEQEEEQEIIETQVLEFCIPTEKEEKEESTLPWYCIASEVDTRVNLGTPLSLTEEQYDWLLNGKSLEDFEEKAEEVEEEKVEVEEEEEEFYTAQEQASMIIDLCSLGRQAPSKPEAFMFNDLELRAHQVSRINRDTAYAWKYFGFDSEYNGNNPTLEQVEIAYEKLVERTKSHSLNREQDLKLAEDIKIKYQGLAK